MRIKNVPFVDIGNDQMFYFKILMGDPFPHIIQHQFLKSFVVYLVGAKHLFFVDRAFCFNNDTNCRTCIGTVTDYQVQVVFDIDRVGGTVVRIFRKSDTRFLWNSSDLYLSILSNNVIRFFLNNSISGRLGFTFIKASFKAMRGLNRFNSILLI